MKDELLQQIEALLEDPVPLLNLPALDRMVWENKLFDLAELLEMHRCEQGGNEVSNEQSQDVENAAG